MILIITLALLAPFALAIGMAFALRDAPTNGSVRREHYTGRRRDGAMGQIDDDARVRWK